jgi:hypothetical protein
MAQLDGIDSSYAFQDSPWPKMLGPQLEHSFDGLQSD